MADTVAVVIADIHGGHKLGLLRPGTLVFDENDEGEEVGSPLPLNAFQVKLWDWYQWDLDFVHKLAAGRPVVLYVNGDVTQGRKYVREWVTTREADQYEIAFGVLQAALSLPNLVRVEFIVGTGSHEMEEATAPLVLRRMLQRESPVPIQVANHGMPQINEVVFDIAHHGPPPGSRRWLEANGLRWYANDIQQRDLDLGRRPPDWVVRSHYHTFAQTASHYRKGTTVHTTEAVLTPGFTGMDSYGRQATRSKYEVHVGLLAWEVYQNKAILKPRFRILDLRRREVIE